MSVDTKRSRVECEAREVFLLMRRDFRVSRNVRALWYFEHLNRNVEIEDENCQPEPGTPDNSDKDLQVIGAIRCPESPVQSDADDPGVTLTYKVRPDTIVTCLSKSYRLVFVLDLSPSTTVTVSLYGRNAITVVNPPGAWLSSQIVAGIGLKIITAVGRSGLTTYSAECRVLYTKLLTCLHSCLQGVGNSLRIPGSGRLFQPQLYITVLAYSPFLACTGDQVLIHGYPLSKETLPAAMERIEAGLELFISALAACIRPAMRRIEAGRRRAREERENEPITGNLFTQSPGPVPTDEGHGHRHHSISSFASDGKSHRPGGDDSYEPSQDLANLGFVSPEWALLNMLRLGLLGIQLLPENTQANIIILTDGDCTVPDANAMQALLTQLRTFTVSCSFLQIQPKLKAPPGFGHTSYPELLHFLATATFGSYLPDCPCSVSDLRDDGQLNLYHRAFLCWSFLTALGDHRHLLSALNPWMASSAQSGLQPLRRRHLLTTLDTCLQHALYVRLREGYTVKRVGFVRKTAPDQKQMVNVELRLPWKPQVSIEYHITSEWPNAQNQKSISKVKIEVWIEAPYEFLRDVIAENRQRVRSPYRKTMLNAFYTSIQRLTHADKLLLHLHSFNQQPTYYSLPDSVKNGIPLFYMPPNGNEPVITSKGLEKEYPDLCTFWRPVCTLDMSIWQKWLHTHSIRLLLTHDVPLSSNLHTASNNTGRFGVVVCRQAATALHDALKDWASFTLMDAHSYVKFEYTNEEDDIPAYFYIIRTCLRPPCLALKVAFLGGIRGAVRQRTIADLRAKLLSLTVRQRPHSGAFLQDVRSKRGSSASQIVAKEMCALTLLTKPIERVLIRYEKVPKDLRKLVRLEEVANEAQARSAILHNSLARYLRCRRWIWQLRRPAKHCLAIGTEAAGYILHALVRRRLQEGFRLALGSNGIVNLIRELSLDNGRKCIVQYVVFPPVGATHVQGCRTHQDSCFSARSTESPDLSEPESSTETDTQLVTELWVEPHEGSIDECPEPCNRWLRSCVQFSDLHRKVFEADRELIECLSTFELLRMVCEAAPGRSLELPSPSIELNGFGRCCGSEPSHSSDERPISVVSSCFNLVSLLSRCQRALLLFSTLSFDGTEASAERNGVFMQVLHRELSSSQDASFRPRQLQELWLLLAEQSREGARYFPWLRQKLEPGRAIPQLGAYIKRVSDWRFVLILLPLKFEDVMIMAENATSRESCLTFPMFVFNVYEPALAASLVAQAHGVNFQGAAFVEDFRPTGVSELSDLHSRIKRTTSADLRPSSIDLGASELFELEPHWFFRGRTRMVSEQLVTEEQQVELEYDLEFSLPVYCGRIDSLVYARAYVMAIYRSLLQSIDVPRVDVLQALEDGRCDEFTIEVDLSDFMPLVCSHFSDYIDVLRREGIGRSNTIDSVASSFSLQSTIVNPEPHPIFCTASCASEHAGLDDSFKNLVSKYFRPVPNAPEYYLFSPQLLDTGSDGPMEEAADSDTGEWTRESTGTKDVSESEIHEQDKTIEFERRELSLNTRDTLTARRSVGSEISSTLSGSIDSVLEVITSELSSRFGSELGDRSQPCTIFLQINCSLRIFHHLKTCSVDSLPTCLVDLFRKSKFNAWDLDFRNLEVTLDLTVLTIFPCTGPINLLQQHISSSPNSEASKSARTSPSDVTDSAKFVFDLSEEIQLHSPVNELPEQERVSLLDIKHGIEMLMTRETILAHTRKEIDSSILAAVLSSLKDLVRPDVVFLETDTDRAFAEQLQLVFVMREDDCLERFRHRLLDRQIGYGVLGGMGDYFYMCSVKDVQMFWETAQRRIQIEQLLFGGLAACTEEANLRPEQLAAPGIQLLLSPLLGSVQTGSQQDDVFMSDDGDHDTPRVDPALHRAALCDVGRSRSLESGFDDRYCIREGKERLGESKTSTHTRLSMSDLSNAEQRDIDCWLKSIPSRSQAAAADTPLERLKSDLMSSAISMASRGGIATEEGYEPDSEMCVTDDWGPNESQEMGQNNGTGRLQRYLKDFWLIVAVEEMQVNIYFYERFPNLHQKLVQQLRDAVRISCKMVNQEILLESLFDTRLCDSLLVPSKDDWNKAPHFDPDDDLLDVEDSLAVRAHFRPGAFGCPCVWHGWFDCHPRLKTAPQDRQRIGSAHGRSIQVLRSLLVKFEVKNRENLFVFRQVTGDVFYLRLHGSIESLDKLLLEKFDGDLLDKQFERSVLLTVHGLTVPDAEITVSLRDALQRKLDEAVLEIVSVTLSRNPNCRLTPDDVKFVQPDPLKPRVVVHLTLPSSIVLSHLFAVGHYLKQHLLKFMHEPNYMLMSGAPRHDLPLRFQSGQTQLGDDNVRFYVFVRPTSAGNKGVACVTQSFVYSDGKLLRCVPSTDLDPRGSPNFFPVPLAETGPCHFLPLTETSLHTVMGHNGRKRVGLDCCVRFAIWERGDIGMDEFTERLRHCVQQALADLVTEYSFLTAPVLIAPGMDSNPLTVGLLDVSWVCGPSSAKPLADEVDDESQVSGFANTRGHSVRRSDGQISSSRPQLTARKRSTSALSMGALGSPPKTQSAKATVPRQSSTRFNFDPLLQVFGKLSSDASASAARQKHVSCIDPKAPPSNPPSPTKRHKSAAPQKTEPIRRSISNLKIQLNPVVVGSWLKWCDHILSVRGRFESAFSKFTLKLESAAMAGQVLYEACAALKTVLHNTNFDAFSAYADPLSATGAVYRMMDVEHLVSYCRHKMQQTDRSRANETMDLALVGHCMQLWKDSLRLGSAAADETPESLATLLNPSGAQGVAVQQFMPLLPDQNSGFVPRQRLLLVTVSGVNMTVLSYNWTTDVSVILNKLFLKLVCWHNARARLLSQICLQKMGLCHFAAVSEAELTSNPYLAMYWTDVGLLTKSILSHKQLGRTDYSILSPQFARILLKPFRYAVNRRHLALSNEDPFIEQSAEVVEQQKYWRQTLQDQLDLNMLFQNLMDSNQEMVYVNEKSFNMLISRSRFVHFVLTPLLFAPAWRKKVSQIRKPLGVVASHGEAEDPPKKQSGSSSPQKRSANSSRRNSGRESEVSSPSASRHASITLTAADAWHLQLQHMLIHEYVNYSRTLGLNVIALDDSEEKHRDYTTFDPLGPAESPHVWLYSATPSGVVLIKLCFEVPYFGVYYYVWDSAQLHPTVRLPCPDISDFKSHWSYLIDCSHVHSFSYDFHLKMVAAYLNGAQKVMFRPGYHMNAFLVDFLQYYACRPAYARNCLYEDRLTSPELHVSAANLYNHLLDHDRAYSLRVVRMRVPSASGGSDSDSDYLLVSTETYKHSAFREYQVLRVVLQDDQPIGTQQTDRNTLRLKYYVMFVSTEESTMPMLELTETQRSKQPSGGRFQRFDQSSVESDTEEEPLSDPQAATYPSLRRRHSTAFVRLSKPLYVPRSLSASAESSASEPEKSERFQVQPVPETRASSRKFTVNLPPVAHDVGQTKRLSIQRSAPRRHRKSTHKNVHASTPPPQGSVLAREQVTYVTYVSERQRKLQTALEDWVTNFKRALKRTVEDAAWHCRRDQLWTRLLTETAHKRTRQQTGGGFWAGSPKGDGHLMTETAELLKLSSGLSVQDFETLLGYVTLSPATETDARLSPFVTNMKDATALGFMRTLVHKFGPDRCRFFWTPGTQSRASKQQLVVLNPNFLDSLALVTMDQKTPGVKVSLVYKDWDSLMSEMNAENRKYRLLAIQGFFEEIVYCLSYYVWTRLND